MPDDLPRELTRALNLARYLASRMVRGCENQEDAAQEGRIAIWEAWGRFEPARGLPFNNLAFTAARRRILSWIGNQDGYASRKRYRLRLEKRAAPVYLLPPSSLDAPVGPQGTEPVRLGATVADGHAGPERLALEAAHVEEILRTLKPRDRQVFCWRQEGWEQTEVARRLGVTGGRVGQLERRALAHLRAVWSESL